MIAFSINRLSLSIRNCNDSARSSESVAMPSYMPNAFVTLKGNCQNIHNSIRTSNHAAEIARSTADEISAFHARQHRMTQVPFRICRELESQSKRLAKTEHQIACPQFVHNNRKREKALIQSLVERQFGPICE